MAMSKLNHIRQRIREAAEESLSNGDALGVSAILGMSTDKELIALSAPWQVNVGTETKPKLKKKNIKLIKPDSGIYLIDAAVHVLLKTARKEKLTV